MGADGKLSGGCLGSGRGEIEESPLRGFFGENDENVLKLERGDGGPTERLYQETSEMYSLFKGWVLW